jgi:hypothetical protein
LLKAIHDGTYKRLNVMKTIRVIAAVILLACAGAAAYYSYSVNFAPLPLNATSGGPPAGISMPRKGSSAEGESKGGKVSPKGAESAPTRRDKQMPTKGGDEKGH